MKPRMHILPGYKLPGWVFPMQTPPPLPGKQTQLSPSEEHIRLPLRVDPLPPKADPFL